MAGNIIEVTAEGASAEFMADAADYVVTIEATNWDSSSVTLQETAGSSFQDSDDPYNTGNALTRTDNGKSVRVSGGLKYRLNCTTLGGSAAGIRAIFNRAT